MKTYLYKAKDGPDRIVTGKMFAATTQEVVDRLMQQGQVATSVVEESAHGVERGRRALRCRAGLSERILFSRQLAQLLAAGVPILRALTVLGEQTSHPAVKEAIGTITDMVRGGEELSTALDRYPALFPDLYRALVRSGEGSGTLERALQRLSEYYEKQRLFQSAVLSAMTYPALIVAVGAATIIFMFVHVFPRIIPLIVGLGGTLPLPTRILIGTTFFVKTHWYWLTLGTLLVLLIGMRALASKAFQQVLFGIRRAMPFFGDLAFKMEFARFARTLETSLANGIPILHALELAVPVVGDPLMREGLAKSAAALKGGSGFGQTLRETAVFPPLVYNLISIGEETGSLETVLGDLADMYEKDCAESVKIATVLIEPVMVLVVGLAVGFLVVALLLPIFEMNVIRM